MALTPKQENFAQAIADGKSQADAYRCAYNAAAMKPETIRKRASELIRDRDVAAMVALLRQQLSDKCMWSREDSIRTLKTVIDNDDASAARIAAVKELNAMHGFNAPVKTEITGKDGGPIANTHAIAPALTPEQWTAAFGGK